MKLCRFQPLQFNLASVGYELRPLVSVGVIEGDTVHEFVGPPLDQWIKTGRTWPLAEVHLLPPALPSKVVCVGRNYIEHAQELGNPIPKEPLIFFKPPSSVIGPEEPIVLPPESQRVDYEGELAIVIGKTCSRLSPDEDFAKYVLGYTCLNDVTARDLQKADVQFTRGKSFDTFCPLGPVIETDLDLGAATVETYVNGERRQHGAACDMIFSIGAILTWISRVMTLVPGDVIATGTPPGVGPLHNGDVVEVVVSGVGTLRNPVMERSAD